MSFFSGRRQDNSQTEEKSLNPHIGFDTVLSASSILDGTLTSTGNIRLDGTFSGKLNITGNILVGETAEIDADIEARNISIAGKVRGNVIGNKVQLLKTGHIWGNIQANSLTTEDGAFIDGKITMNLNPPVEKAIIEESDNEDEETIASIDSDIEETQSSLAIDSDERLESDETEQDEKEE